MADDNFTIKDLVDAAQRKLDEAKNLSSGKGGRTVVQEHAQRLKNTIGVLQGFLKETDPVTNDLCPQQLMYLPIEPVEKK